MRFRSLSLLRLTTLVALTLAGPACVGGAGSVDDGETASVAWSLMSSKACGEIGRFEGCGRAYLSRDARWRRREACHADEAVAACVKRTQPGWEFINGGAHSYDWYVLSPDGLAYRIILSRGDWTAKPYEIEGYAVSDHPRDGAEQAKAASELASSQAELLEAVTADLVSGYGMSPAGAARYAQATYDLARAARRRSLTALDCAAFVRQAFGVQWDDVARAYVARGAGRAKAFEGLQAVAAERLGMSRDQLQSLLDSHFGKFSRR